MDEIIEGAVGALHILARDPQNRLIIRSHHCIPIIIQVSIYTFCILVPIPVYLIPILSSCTALLII